MPSRCVVFCGVSISSFTSETADQISPDGGTTCHWTVAPGEGDASGSRSRATGGSAPSVTGMPVNGANARSGTTETCRTSAGSGGKYTSTG
ncbi:hypothetical protein ACFMQL_35045 [Nonomuraea fastidiosa]|uniref:hypothetical protein n=1 Tax=Nonomuraea TaxID=83681 RepID=UPI00324AAD78